MLKKLFAGSIAQNTLKTTLVFGIRLIAQAGTLILLARLLGPAQFGEFSAIAALAVLMGTLSTFGTHIVLLGETAIDPANATGVLRWAIPTTLCCGTVLFFIYLVVATVLFPRGNTAFSVIALIGITELLVQPMNQLACAELQGLNKTALSQTLLTLPLALRAIGLAILVISHAKSELVLFSTIYFTSTLITFFTIQALTRRNWPKFFTWYISRKKITIKLTGYAILVLTYYGTSETDKVLAPKLTTQYDSGIFCASSRILSALTMPIIAMTVSALPKIFKTDKNIPTRKLNHLLLTTSALYGIVTSIAAFLFSPLPYFILGKEFYSTIATIKLLAFAFPATCLRLSICSIFMGMQAPWIRASLESFGLILFSTLAYILSIKYQYNGFLYSIIISEWIMATIGVLYLQIQKNPSDKS